MQAYTVRIGLCIWGQVRDQVGADLLVTYVSRSIPPDSSSLCLPSVPCKMSFCQLSCKGRKASTKPTWSEKQMKVLRILSTSTGWWHGVTVSFTWKFSALRVVPEEGSFSPHAISFQKMWRTCLLGESQATNQSCPISKWWMTPVASQFLIVTVGIIMDKSYPCS